MSTKLTLKSLAAAFAEEQTEKAHIALMLAARECNMANVLSELAGRDHPFLESVTSPSGGNEDDTSAPEEPSPTEPLDVPEAPLDVTNSAPAAAPSVEAPASAAPPVASVAPPAAAPPAPSAPQAAAPVAVTLPEAATVAMEANNLFGMQYVMQCKKHFGVEDVDTSNPEQVQALVVHLKGEIERYKEAQG